MKMTFSKQIFICCGISICGSAFLNGFDVFAQWFSVSRNGSDTCLWMEMFLILPLLLIFVTVPVSVILLIFRKTRRVALFTLLASLIYPVVAIGMFRIGDWVRMHGFHKLAERSVPLVQAIHRFEDKKGCPPNSLEELIPDYLDSIPHTGMGAYPDYKYEVSEDANSWRGNPWAIYIDTPSGGINFDMFMYLPDHNYPEMGYGGYLERIGDWAYVHE